MMPAYRSPAEAEVREAVVARIRERRPSARIIHEINAGTYGNRIDLIAVDRAEILAFEIKSAKDKLDRLPAQMAAMKGVAHRAIAAIHEKFLVEQETGPHAAHFERDGKMYLRLPPDPWSHDSSIWVYPETRRCMDPNGWDSHAVWRFPDSALETPLPAAALDLLWRDELYELCGALRIPVGRRATMSDMLPALRWHCTGKELTHGICAMLRSRNCVEADPAVFERVAA